MNLPTHDGLTAGQAAVLERAIPALKRLESLLAATDAARASSLRNLLPALKHLERAIAEDCSRQLASLHTLVTDDRLNQLETLAAEQRSEFDALDLIGQFRFGTGEDLWASEAFHSNALAWLLDPNESHGVGDCFLQHFLRRAGVPEPIRSVDWATAEVKREWGHEVNGQSGRLDLLVVNEAQRVMCAIENKTFTGEHDEQLTRYRKALATESPTFSRHFVFLTPWGIEPYRDEEKAYWKPLTYSTIRDILQQIVDDDKHSPNAAVRAFLCQYATTLKRNIVPDTSISKLAKRIWLEHREALDLLIEHRPN